MATYLGTVKLGGLYNNGTALVRPTKPWINNSNMSDGDGNIHSMSGSMANYSIGNTPSDDAKRLQWVKIKDGSKTLLICDRNILVKVSWDDLNAQGLVSGKVITIDGAQYKCRILSGGSDRRSDFFSGCTPVNNEWDRFITREEVVTGLPAPVSSDFADNLTNTTSRTGVHNTFWYWYKVSSWCQETTPSGKMCRGYNSARHCSFSSSSVHSSSTGYRPVLEELNAPPLISDTNRDLGDKNTDFTILYYVSDTNPGDTLTVTETLDGQTKKTFTAARNVNNTITVPVKTLSLASHTVGVTVSDGKGGSAARLWTFRRTNSPPTISGTDSSLGDKNLGFTFSYTVNDTDGDTLTVTEQLNTETLRTINNAPKGEPLSLSITSQKLYSFGLNSVNTLKITVSDGKGGTAYRSLTFKRTNSAPVISGQDVDLGLQVSSFATTYTVNDIEGDVVTVTEFVDDDVIRTFQTTLGRTETLSLTRNKWLTLANGNHFLRVEAVDKNRATAVRVWNFQKSENVIEFQFSSPEETDARATKVLITPTWRTAGSVAKVYACNNAFDSSPTWEDITAQVTINRVFNFTNNVKTAEKWGVDVKFVITKNEGYDGEVSVSGFGGAYE